MRLSTKACLESPVSGWSISMAELLLPRTPQWDWRHGSVVEYLFNIPALGSGTLLGTRELAQSPSMRVWMVA